MTQNRVIPAGMSDHNGLAAALSLTPQRIYQLVAQGILVVADEETGLFETASATERYHVYRSAPGEVRWERFATRIEQLATELQPRLDALMQDQIKGQDEFRSVSGEVNEFLSSMRFLICAHGDTWALPFFDSWAKSLQGAVCSRALQLLADLHGTDWDTAYQQLVDDLARGDGGDKPPEVKAAKAKRRGKRPTGNGELA